MGGKGLVSEMVLQVQREQGPVGTSFFTPMKYSQDESSSYPASPLGHRPQLTGSCTTTVNV